MTPGAHLLASWLFAEHTVSTPRERRGIALIGIVPDLDGIGLAADLFSGGGTDHFATYHHLLGHNLLSGLLASGAATLFVRSRKPRVFLMSLAVFHLHLACDLVGSKGPDGYLWPLHYLYPFVPGFELSWRGQWLLNGWQNTAILLLLFAAAIHHAIPRRRSFVEVISRRLDRAIFAAIEKRWPARAAELNSSRR